jgi:hypothetical protein
MQKRCAFNRKIIAGIRRNVYGAKKGVPDRTNYGGKDTDLNKLLRCDAHLC